jgi:hypothetical protein
MDAFENCVRRYRRGYQRLPTQEAQQPNDWSGYGRPLGATPDPAAQTQPEIRTLRRYLELADPELSRRIKLRLLGTLVFAHPRASVDGRQSFVPAFGP